MFLTFSNINFFLLKKVGIKEIVFRIMNKMLHVLESEVPEAGRGGGFFTELILTCSYHSYQYHFNTLILDLSGMSIYK